MKRKVMIGLLLMITLAILSGCAANLKMQNIDSVSVTTEIDMLIEPYESLGIMETEAIKSGDVTILHCIIPDILMGEYYPGRIKWNSWVVDTNGKEYYAQLLFAGVYYSGELRGVIVVDGKPSGKAKILNPSTLVEYAYDLNSKEYKLERQKFLHDTENYRKETVNKYGTEIGPYVTKFDFLKAVKGWNRYQTPKGILLSPLGEKEIKEIAAINPQYSWTEKLAGSGRFAVTMDPIATAVGVAIDVFRSMNGGIPSMGWDYNSQFPSRREMGIIIEYMSRMRKELIAQINQFNAKKLYGGER